MRMAILLWRERSPGAVTNMEHVHGMVALVESVDNSVGVWPIAKKQMAEFLAFGNECAAMRKALQAVDCFGEIVEPGKRVFRKVRFDEFVDGLRVALGAMGQPNEVWHVCGGRIPGLGGPGARGPFPRLRGLGGFLGGRRLGRRCRGGAGRLRRLER